MKKNKKIIKIGFDLDGVILDNPLKNFRFFAKALKFIKPIIFGQKKEPFYYPKNNLEQFLWLLIHKSSFRINPNIFRLKNLVKEKKIIAYVISGRYQCLKKDFFIWKKKLEILDIFKEFYFNEKNFQPNEFKNMMIKKLKLDIYVEDNWDIVQKLNSQSKAEIFWLTNFFDQLIPYKNKFMSLSDVIDKLEYITDN